MEREGVVDPHRAVVRGHVRADVVVGGVEGDVEVVVVPEEARLRVRPRLAPLASTKGPVRAAMAFHGGSLARRRA